MFVLVKSKGIIAGLFVNVAPCNKSSKFQFMILPPQPALAHACIQTQRFSQVEESMKLALKSAYLASFFLFAIRSRPLYTLRLIT